MRSRVSRDGVTPSSMFIRRRDGCSLNRKNSPAIMELGYNSGEFDAMQLLWATALDGLFTSSERKHSGHWVATERIKRFLGPGLPIYRRDNFASVVMPNIFSPECCRGCIQTSSCVRPWRLGADRVSAGGRLYGLSGGAA